MKTFVSHSHAQADDADALALALRGAGHDAVLDRDLVKGGDEYNAGLRAALQATDLFIFMITPDAVRKGCFALSEVEFARQRWPNPVGNVLPVMWQPTPMPDIPRYLRAPSILHPVGNAVTETVARVSDIAAKRGAGGDGRKRRRLLLGLGGALLIAGAIAAVLWPRAPAPEPLCLVRALVTASPTPVSTLDAGQPGGVRSFIVGADGAAQLDIVGLTDAAPRWTIEIAGADGQTAARFELRGCPDGPQELADGKGRSIRVEPRNR
jgi:hypothetical protein